MSIGERERPQIKAFRLGARPWLPIVKFTFFIRIGVKGVEVKKGNGKETIFTVEGLPI